MNHQQKIDLTKLFSVIDSIVCAILECVDTENAKTSLSIGYLNDKILLKSDDGSHDSICRYETNSIRDAKQELEMIIEEKQLDIQIITYYFDVHLTNVTSDFYRDNNKIYTFDARNRSDEEIKVSHKVHLQDVEIDYQELCDNYSNFLKMLSNNEHSLSIIEVSTNPNKRLRKKKLLDLLVD